MPATLDLHAPLNQVFQFFVGYCFVSDGSVANQGHRIMIYSAWGGDGSTYTFIEGDQLTEQQRQMEPELRLVKLFDAASWNDAMRQYHEWQGWEPYKPMLNADGKEFPEDFGPSPT